MVFRAEGDTDSVEQHSSFSKRYVCFCKHLVSQNLITPDSMASPKPVTLTLHLETYHGSALSFRIRDSTVNLEPTMELEIICWNHSTAFGKEGCSIAMFFGLTQALHGSQFWSNISHNLGQPGLCTVIFISVTTSPRTSSCSGTSFFF